MSWPFLRFGGGFSYRGGGEFRELTSIGQDFGFGFLGTAAKLHPDGVLQPASLQRPICVEDRDASVVEPPESRRDPPHSGREQARIGPILDIRERRRPRMV